jgi:hypothetical protein
MAIAPASMDEEPFDLDELAKDIGPSSQPAPPTPSPKPRSKPEPTGNKGTTKRPLSKGQTRRKVADDVVDVEDVVMSDGDDRE